MVNVQIKGIEVLSEMDKQDVQKIVDNSYEKIKRKTKVDFVLKLVIKTMTKEGEKKDKSKHYSIQAGISGEVRPFEASSDGWDLHKVLHQALEKLENQAEHAFHSSDQH
jgi:hypothetical protein